MTQKGIMWGLGKGFIFLPQLATPGFQCPKAQFFILSLFNFIVIINFFFFFYFELGSLPSGKTMWSGR